MLLEDELRAQIERDATVLFMKGVKAIVDMELPQELLSMEGTHEELAERAGVLVRILRKNSRPQHAAHALNYLALAKDPKTSAYVLYERSVQLERKVQDVPTN